MSNVFGTCFNLFDTRYGDTLNNQSQSPSPSIDGTIEHTNHKHATPMILDVLNEPQSLQTPNASDSKCGEESTEDIDTEMFLASHPPTPLNSNINYNTDKSDTHNINDIIDAAIQSIELDPHKIKVHISDKQYNKQYLSLMQRELFIAEFTHLRASDEKENKEYISCIETIDEFHSCLIQRLQNKSTVHHSYPDVGDTSTQPNRPDDIVFVWNKKIDDIYLTDHHHFLYICSLIIHQWNEEMTSSQNTDHISLVDHQSVLLYLHSIQMNVLLFKSISIEVFIKSLRTKMTHAPNAQTGEQYAEMFHNKIKHFPIQSIASSSSKPFTISFTYSQDNFHCTSLRDCTVNDLLYIIRCVIQNKDFAQHFSALHHLKEQEQHILDTFKHSQMNGKQFRKMPKKEFVEWLSLDVETELGTLFDRIMHYPIWNPKVKALRKCTIGNILYIVVCIINNERFAKDYKPLDLTSYASYIMHYFIAQNMKGSTLQKTRVTDFIRDLSTCFDKKDKVKVYNNPALHTFYQRVKQADVNIVSAFATNTQHTIQHVHDRHDDNDWSQLVDFSTIKQVGWLCTDGIVAIADIVEKQPANNKIKLKCRFDGYVSSHLQRGFVIDVPNHRLKDPKKEVIQKSHKEIFAKWMTVLNAQYQYKSAFRMDIWSEMTRMVLDHPQILFTIQHQYYKVGWVNKTHLDILKSLLCWSLSVRCEKRRCHAMHKLKMDCHCDVNQFPRYTYEMLMAIKRCQNSDKNDMLRILQRDIDSIVNDLCAFLHKPEQGDAYCEDYAQYLKLWLHNDLYNFACSYCGAINNTIMINRAMHYVTTLRNCRLCGITQPKLTMRTRGDKPNNLHRGNGSDSVDWFCSLIFKALRKYRKIVGKLRGVILRCKYALNVIKPEVKERQLLKDLNGTLQESPYELFDDLIYYLRRFWDDIDEWVALRINIALNYYFYECKETTFVNMETLMRDAGIDSYDKVIFKDSYFRALYQTTNQKNADKLIEILFGNQDKLCVDPRMLTIFRRLTPSVTVFATQILNEFGGIMNKDGANDTIHLLQTLSNYKMDKKVFSVLKKKEFIGAIRKFDAAEMKMIGDENEFPIFVFGSFAEYWNVDDERYVAPKYKDLEHELKHNSLHKISEDEYKTFMEKVDQIHPKMDLKAQNRASWCNRTKIKPGTPIHKEHLLAIAVQVSTHPFQRSVRDKLIQFSTIKEMIQKQSEVGWFLRRLKEAVVLYGDMLHKNGEMYIGMNPKMLFNELQAHFYLPRSTTSDKDIAPGFAGDEGVVVCLKNMYNIPQPYFRVGWLSGHVEEAECMFFGAALAITGIEVQNVMDERTAQYQAECVRAILLFQTIVDGRLIIKDDWPDLFTLEKIISEFMRVKFDGEEAQARMDRYFYSLFSHLYNKQSEIWINMDEINDHICDKYLIEKFKTFGGKYKNMAKTFKWKVSREEVQGLKYEMKPIRSPDSNYAIEQGAFYMMMRPREEDDNDFDFVVSMDENSWSDDANAVELSIDLYCDTIDCRIVCDHIILKKQDTEHNEYNVSKFMHKYNGRLCTIDELPEPQDDEEHMVWEISVRYTFTFNRSEEDEKDNTCVALKSRSQNLLHPIIAQCIESLNNTFLKNHQKELMEHCDAKKPDIILFAKMEDHDFMLFLKQMYDTQHTLATATCHKQSDIRHRNFARNSGNKQIQDLTHRDLLSLLDQHLLAPDDPNRKLILQSFTESGMSGKDVLAQSKKVFVNSFKQPDQKQIPRGILIKLYGQIKGFDGTKQVYCDHEKEVHKWYQLFDVIKLKIREKDGFGKVKKSVRKVDRDEVRQSWPYQIWDKYHRQSKDTQFRNTMTSVLLKDQTVAQLEPETKLRIKTVLAYYELNKNEIPEFETLKKEADLKIDDDDQLKHTYDGVRDEVNTRKEETALNIKPLLSLQHAESLRLEKSMSFDTASSVHSDAECLLPIENLKTYDQGQFVRYKILEPMYESLAEECIMNSAYNITAAAFNKILAKSKDIHRRVNMISSTSSTGYGISRYEPIRVQHIVAIIMYIYETEYSKELTRSYLQLNVDKELLIKFHCSNFYWFGRYLFEAIEFFGEKFDEEASDNLFQGCESMFKFDIFGYRVTFARSTTPQKHIALHFSGDGGIVIELIPKYKGALNATKVLNLGEMLDDRQERLFFGRGCMVQIRNIHLSGNKHHSKRFMEAITYLEKVLKQTIFDSRFYNSKHLYKTQEVAYIVQDTLFKLIEICKFKMNTKCSQDKTKEKIADVFYELVEKEGDSSIHQILYVVELLQHWCLKRNFVTFESLPFELPYMVHDELRLFFIRYQYQMESDGLTNYVINIDELCELMPNLTAYRDMHQEVVYLDSDPVDIIDRIDSNLAKYYQLMITNKDSSYDRRFRLFCDREEFDAKEVKEQLGEGASECMFLNFDDHFPMNPIKNQMIYSGSDAKRMKYIFDVIKECAKRNMNIQNVISKYTESQIHNTADDLHIIDELNENLALYYKSVGDINRYYKAEEDEKCHELDLRTEGKFKSWCAQRQYNDTLVLEELSKDAEHCTLCEFDDQFPLKMHIHSRKHRLTEIHAILQKCRSKTEIRRYLNEYQAVFRVLPNLAPHEVADHIVEALEDIQFNFIEHKHKEAMLKQLFENKLKKMKFTIKHHTQLGEFCKQLKSIGIAEDIATDIFLGLLHPDHDGPTAGAIHHMLKSAENEVIIERVMRALQSEEFEYVAIDVSEYKHVFATMFKEQLDKFYEPISKLHGVRLQDLVDVAMQIKLFDDETAQKLSKFLFDKLFYDMEHIKPWPCKMCKFLNRKMMVGCLWRLYNQLNECGLCGVCRYNQTNVSTTASCTTDTSAPNAQSHDNVEPKTTLGNDIETLQSQVNWNAIVKKACSLKPNHQDGAMYLDACTVEDVISLVEAKCSDKLDGVKDEIKKWCHTQSIDGSQLLAFPKRKDFVKSVSEHLTKAPALPLAKLYTALMKVDVGCCYPLKRVCIILNHFDKLMHDVSSLDQTYPYQIKEFLNSLHEYSAIRLLDDIHHILHDHKALEQTYIQCNAPSNECLHLKTAQREKNKLKTMREKQEYFHCDVWTDYVYISILSKAHSAILHDECADAIQSDADIITKYMDYPVHSQGVFIQYHAITPLHSNLRKELIHNRDFSITETVFKQALSAVHALMMTDKWKNEQAQSKRSAYKTSEMYGVTVGDYLAVENVLVLYLYCNDTALCAHFRAAYRTDGAMLKHKYHYYWFGRFIYSSIHFFGKKPQNEQVFYHGLGTKFLFNSFSAIFEAPTSTSTDFSAARNMTGGNGIVLKLKAKYKNELNQSKCLDVEHTEISSYRNEKERLFAGMTVLAIIDIGYEGRKGKWVQLTNAFQLLLYFEKIIEQSEHQRAFYNYGARPPKKAQTNILVPLIRHQMRRNGGDREEKKQHDDDVADVKEDKQYLYCLFEHFCDSKREYLNLKCINDERQAMSKSLQRILFEIHGDHEGAGGDEDDVQIHRANIKLIFPNLKQYKNHMGYWITLQ
eukprot:225813_1